MKTNMSPQVFSEAYFWARVKRGSPDECWEWTRSRTAQGYGWCSIGKKTGDVTHRVAWRLTNGEIPPGMYVCHKCDNRPCCNPAHLFVGTATDNNRDMASKGRCNPHPPHGVDHPLAKLTESDVIEIRALHGPCVGYKALAAKYGVAHSLIHRIVRRQSWAHVA